MSKKTLVTHIFPDLDAITSIWLFIRWHPEFSEVDLEFVPAGSTYKNQAVDSDPTITHVDTGMGQFDHHQLSAKTCAAELVFKYLLSEKFISSKHEAGVARLVRLVVAIDNFDDFFWPDASADRYDISLPELINNLKISGKLNDKELVYQGMLLLDAALTGMMVKIKAEEEIDKGIKFDTKWGQSLALTSKHSLVSKLGQKLGYAVVVVLDPKTGFVSIKSQPKDEIDLGPVYEKLRVADPNASWFFHQSRHIIVSGSRHNPAVRPTHLSLEDLIDLVKNS